MFSSIVQHNALSSPGGYVSGLHEVSGGTQLLLHPGGVELSFGVACSPGLFGFPLHPCLGLAQHTWVMSPWAWCACMGCVPPGHDMAHLGCIKISVGDLPRN